MQKNSRDTIQMFLRLVFGSDLNWRALTDWGVVIKHTSITDTTLVLMKTFKYTRHLQHARVNILIKRESMSLVTVTIASSAYK